MSLVMKFNCIVASSCVSDLWLCQPPLPSCSLSLGAVLHHAVVWSHRIFVTVAETCNFQKIPAWTWITSVLLAHTRSFYSCLEWCKKEQGPDAVQLFWATGLKSDCVQWLRWTTELLWVKLRDRDRNTVVLHWGELL